MSMSMCRQGDVLLRRLPTRARIGTQVQAQGHVILAYGEATGHAHEVVEQASLTEGTGPAAQLFEEPDGRRFLFVDRPCALIHSEHGTIALAPGCYEVIRQREYAPKAMRQVVD